jgi:class I fructose-bisphosphate aldolase
MYTKPIKNILNNYSFQSPAIKSKLFKILNTGKLSGTGKIIISAVDQGFEHGADKSFSINPPSYNPEYHYNFAIKNGLNALAGPIGFLETATTNHPGIIPLILKINSNSSLTHKNQSPNQAITASIDDAIRLGCDAIGMTIYPGSNQLLHMITDLSEIIKEAKSKGLAVIIWSYARGEGISDPMAVDTISYGAQIACQLGADIIKVKIPNATVENPEIKKLYTTHNIKFDTISDRIKIVINSCFAGKRMVIFSGGETKNDTEIINDISGIITGGGNGSIIGRNIFQRTEPDAQKLVTNIINKFKIK